jgi:WS/DGAT/MGAT family acyltransferase
VEKLSFQDAAFLRLDSPVNPYHVGGLLVFAPPPGAPRDHLRRLVARLGRELPAADPLFLRKLDPASPASPRWIRAEDFDPAQHIHHYALPSGGGTESLLGLVARVHERQLDRTRPLWEWHVIEGLPRGRFALYCKVHHALIDGIGAQRLLTRLLGTAPGALRVAPWQPPPAHETARHAGWLGDLAGSAEALAEQGRAVPELAAMLLRMYRERTGADVPPLPFTAPRAPMNQNITPRRRVVIADLPLAGLRRAGKSVDGTVNDAFLAVCGGALRSYLLEQGALPRQTLLAGVPVSVKDAGDAHANALSTLVCPFETHTRDPRRRLRNIARVTQRAKQDLRGLSRTARQDYMNLILVPAIAFTLAHAATAIPPPFNVIVSNVPGPSGPLYLGESRLEALYPLSVINDAQALNLTGIGCATRLCVAATACPDALPGIERLDRHIAQAWRELKAAL